MRRLNIPIRHRIGGTHSGTPCVGVVAVASGADRSFPKCRQTSESVLPTPTPRTAIPGGGSPCQAPGGDPWISEVSPRSPEVDPRARSRGRKVILESDLERLGGVDRLPPPRCSGDRCLRTAETRQRPKRHALSIVPCSEELNSVVKIGCRPVDESDRLKSDGERLLAAYLRRRGFDRFSEYERPVGGKSLDWSVDHPSTAQSQRPQAPSHTTLLRQSRRSLIPAALQVSLVGLVHSPG
jgi:hypothetical protein